MGGDLLNISYKELLCRPQRGLLFWTYSLFPFTSNLQSFLYSSQEHHITIARWSSLKFWTIHLRRKWPSWPRLPLLLSASWLRVPLPCPTQAVMTKPWWRGLSVQAISLPPYGPFSLISSPSQKWSIVSKSRSSRIQFDDRNPPLSIPALPLLSELPTTGNLNIVPTPRTKASEYSTISPYSTASHERWANRVFPSTTPSSPSLSNPYIWLVMFRAKARSCCKHPSRSRLLEPRPTTRRWERPSTTPLEVWSSSCCPTTSLVWKAWSSRLAFWPPFWRRWWLIMWSIQSTHASFFWFILALTSPSRGALDAIPQKADKVKTLVHWLCSYAYTLLLTAFVRSFCFLFLFFFLFIRYQLPYRIHLFKLAPINKYTKDLPHSQLMNHITSNNYNWRILKSSPPLNVSPDVSRDAQKKRFFFLNVPI